MNYANRYSGLPKGRTVENGREEASSGPENSGLLLACNKLLISHPPSTFASRAEQTADLKSIKVVFKNGMNGFKVTGGQCCELQSCEHSSLRLAMHGKVTSYTMTDKALKD